MREPDAAPAGANGTGTETGLPDLAGLREMLLASERRRAEAEESRHRAQLVLGGLEILSATLDGEAVLAGILDIVGSVVPFRAAAVVVEADDELVVVMASGSSAPFRTLEPDRFTKRVLKGRATVVSDLEQVPSLRALAAPPFDHRSALFAPVRSAELSGMLICLDDKIGGYSHHDLDVVGHVGPLVSQALRRYDEDRRIADLVAQLDRLAHTDALTGLANRARFEDELRHRIEQHHERRVPFALLQIDVDGLKVVNDTYGHHAGDRLIKATADAIKHVTRPADLCARLGGDEFAVILHADDPLAIAGTVAERLVDRLSVGDDLLTPRVSIGVGLCPVSEDEPERVVEFADRAMYRAKGGGGSRIVTVDPEMQETWRREREVERELEHALEADQLQLHYQPILQTTTGDVMAYESLLRWVHPRLGAIEADAFLSDVLDSELIVRLGRWVLARAVAETADWLRGGPDRRVAVNVAVRQVLNPDFTAEVLHTLETSGLQPRQLEIELSDEPITFRRRLAVDGALQAIQQAGIGLALPALGLGPSTLDRWLASDTIRIKINRRFTTDLPHDERQRAVVEAMADLSGRLGLSSVLEGVENDDQLDWARSVGIDEVQGHLFGQPGPLTPPIGAAARATHEPAADPAEPRRP